MKYENYFVTFQGKIIKETDNIVAMKAKPFIKWVRIDDAGFLFMLSNSDCKGKNEEDNFFDVLYGAYHRARIYEQDGTPNIVIRNYQISE